MSQIPLTKTVFVPGAFQGKNLPCSAKQMQEAGISQLDRGDDLTANIEDQAESLLDLIIKLKQPVRLIGHSLGALVAYRIHEIAPQGVIERTALLNCGSIGEAIPVSFDPLRMFAGMISAFSNPESPFALYEATNGKVQIGERTEGLVMLSGTNDHLIPTELSQRTAARIGARLILLKGGHHLLRDDGDGRILKALALWCKTGKGLRKLPCVATDEKLVTA